jgi:hypothetical protein
MSFLVPHKHKQSQTASPEAATQEKLKTFNLPYDFPVISIFLLQPQEMALPLRNSAPANAFIVPQEQRQTQKAVRFLTCQYPKTVNLPKTCPVISLTRSGTGCTKISAMTCFPLIQDDRNRMAQESEALGPFVYFTEK